MHGTYVNNVCRRQEKIKGIGKRAGDKIMQLIIDTLYDKTKLFFPIFNCVSAQTCIITKSKTVQQHF